MSDLISRQAAIDALERVKTATSENGERWIAKINAQMELEQLPSAQHEIILCKDCIYKSICSFKRKGMEYCSFAEK